MREVSVLEKTTRLANHSTKLERDGLKMGIDPFTASGLQRAEQSIASGFICVCSGHGNTVEMLMMSSSKNTGTATPRSGRCVVTRLPDYFTRDPCEIISPSLVISNRA